MAVAQVDMGRQNSRKPRWRSLWRPVAVVLCLGLLVAVLLWSAHRFNNVGRMSDAEFARRLDESIERGRQWVQDHRDKLAGPNANVALLFMLKDMDRLAPTRTFRELVDEVMDRPQRFKFWKRLLDPQYPVSALEMNNRLREQNLNNRWVVYALNPRHVRLDERDRDALFDSERWSGRKLTHQLWALRHLRVIGGDERVTEELLRYLSKRVADENVRDLRVCDLYYQRVAFVLMGQHPELIRRRWVERIIENQRDDGGWSDRWLLFSSSSQWNYPASNAHSTVQALWVLYQLKYAHPARFGP